MVQIIKEGPKKRGFLESVLGGVAEGIEPAIEKYKQMKSSQQANESYKRITGQDLSGLPPEAQAKLAQELMKGKQKEALFQKKSDWANEALEYDSPSFDEESQVDIDNRGGKSSPLESRLHSDEKIAKVAIVDPNLARELRAQNDTILKQKQHKQDLELKKFESDRSFHAKGAEPILASAEEIYKKAPIRKGLINQQRRDIASGSTEGFLPFLVEKTGAELYRTPEAARFKTASKQRFIENLSSLGGGARPNQFIEKQLVDSQPVLGRSSEANLTILDMEEFIDDLELQRAKYVREFAKEDMEKFGYVRNDVGMRADDKMEGYAEQRQEEMAYNIRKRHEDQMSDEDLTREIAGKHVVPGTPLTLRAAKILMIKNNDDPKKAQAEAKRLGYLIPNEATYKRGAQ